MTCWLCRIVGHKWTTDYCHTIDGMSVRNVLLWAACLRCGKEAPIDLRVYDDAPVDNASVSA